MKRVGAGRHIGVGNIHRAAGLPGSRAVNLDEQMRTVGKIHSGATGGRSAATQNHAAGVDMQGPIAMEGPRRQKYGAPESAR